VPLFVEEVTRLLVERGAQGGVQAIPPTLQQSLAARLDRLGPARELAQIGAVLGGDFAYPLCATLQRPSDSSLLWDAVRVMVRLLKAADALVGAFVWRNHRRAAKKRAGAIKYARDRPTRVQHYRQLIKLAQATLAYADQAATLLWQASDPMAAALWQAEFRHYRPLIERIVAQTERRVLRGEAIAANEKIVSLFEPHADIIVKGGREVQYGHKLNLTTGRSGLILDLVLEAGNPADSDRFLPMLNRHIDFYGQAPTGRCRRRLCKPS